MRKRLSHTILLSALLLPYALNVDTVSTIIHADVLENVVVINGKKLKKYTTNNLHEVPADVKNNPNFYYFIDELIQQKQIGIITSDKTDPNGKINFQTFTKDDDYTLGEIIEGLAPDAEHYVILPEKVVGDHSQLGLNDVKKLREEYQKLDSGIQLQQSEPKTTYLYGEYADLPTYVKNNPDPITNHGLQIIEGQTYYTTDKVLAQSQPNFTKAPFTADEIAKATPGKADPDKVSSGDLTQLPDENIPKKSYSTTEHNKNLLDMKNGLLTLGSVDKTATPEQETTNKSEAESHDSYRIKGYQPIGSPQKTKPDGKLGIDYELTGNVYLSDWQFENVTDQPKNGVVYDDVTADNYDEATSQARFWEKSPETRNNVTLAKLQADFDAGLIVRDTAGKRMTSVSDVIPSLTDKKIEPYDFDPDNIVNDFPGALNVLNPAVDLLPRYHIKGTLATIPQKVGSNFSKKSVYIKDLYTKDGKIDTSKLIGQKSIDWDYTHVFEVNGSKKFVSLANMHLPGHPESLANEMTPAEEGQVYEYWELDSTTNRYKKTKWQYLLSAVPSNVEYHRHELDTAQDSYNNGVGTATTWYQLKGTANFESNVANSIKTGTGNAGGIDSWAYSMMGFRPVKNTAESELMKPDPNDQNITKTGHVSKNNLIYRTTVQQYGQSSLNTPPSEILNGYIYMELKPYINPATGVQAIDGKGEPVFTWNKFYYTDKEEYYALEKIVAYNYGYHIEDNDKYSYTVAEPQYQTREELPYYQKLAPVYAYSDDAYSYDMKKHAYLPTKYAYREDNISWQYYDLMAIQPLSYQEKLYTQWYSYDLPEIRRYSWQAMMSETEESTDRTSMLPDTGNEFLDEEFQDELPETGSRDDSILSMIGAIGIVAWFVMWQKLKKK